MNYKHLINVVVPGKHDITFYNYMNKVGLVEAVHAVLNGTKVQAEAVVDDFRFNR